MGYSEQAIRKGMAAEYLAKAFYSKQGYQILVPDTHETAYDFIAGTTRVQVKAEVSYGDLIRFRNKHGANNAAYKPDDYDVLAGVWVARSRIYLFHSHEINGQGFGESLTVDTHSGRSLSNHRRLVPFYSGPI